MKNLKRKKLNSGKMQINLNNGVDKEFIVDNGVKSRVSQDNSDLPPSAETAACETRDLTPAAVHLNLSNQYLAVNNLNLAKQHLHQALRLNPHYAEGYNNLGRLLYKQRLFKDAIPHFEKALRLHPDYFEAHYNLAHALSQLNQFNQALYHYQAAVALQPEHAGARNNLGLIFFEAENYDQAKIHLEKAAELEPLEISCRLFLGQTYIALGKTQEAKNLYEFLLSKDNQLSEAHHNLAVLLLWEKDNLGALTHFKKALQYQPSNETAAHMVQALSGESQSNAPTLGYVRDLFDQYADYYNPHVKEKLQYQAPYLLRDAIGRYLKEKLRAGRVLDLGCGTGLCGIYFRDLARELIGVDISPKMIEKAKKLIDAYDELIVQDILEYLGCSTLEAGGRGCLHTSEKTIDAEKQFNLILASDVLVYFGDLDSLFRGISRHLTLDGHFLFTTEILHSSQKQYLLQQTGRFAHHDNYIQTLSEQHAFNIVFSETVVLRKQEGCDINGMLYIVKKS